jgi:hypothetical protein
MGHAAVGVIMPIIAPKRILEIESSVPGRMRHAGVRGPTVHLRQWLFGAPFVLRSRSQRRALLRRSCRTAGNGRGKLALFEKLKARGGFAGEDRAELLKVERMLDVCCDH